MAPLRMSEERAAALLDKWRPAKTKPLLDTPLVHRGELHHPLLLVSDLWEVESLGAACEEASKLRQYLEALSLISCCRGFDPEQNPSFWRRFFRDRSSFVTHKITRGVFTSIFVDCNRKVDSEVTAATLFVLLSPTRVKTIRSDLEKELEVYLERAPPPLEIKVLLDSILAMSIPRRALQRLDCIWASQPTVTGTKEVQVVVDLSHPLQRNTASSETIEALVDIASIPCVSLEEVHLSIIDDSRKAFRALMQELVRRDTVRAMSWTLACDPEYTAAGW